MFTPDRHVENPIVVNLTDYSAKRPQGCRSFYSFISFTDDSTVLLANIFATTRCEALDILMHRFADCRAHIETLSLRESDD